MAYENPSDALLKELNIINLPQIRMVIPADETNKEMRVLFIQEENTFPRIRSFISEVKLLNKI